MKILAIGDPHGDVAKLRKIQKKEVDLILVTGDIGRADFARKRFFENVKRKKKGLEPLAQDAKSVKAAYMEIYTSAVAVMKYLAQFAPVYLIYGNVESHNSDVREENRKWNLNMPYLTDAIERIKGVRIINNRIARFRDIRIGGLEFFLDDCWVREFQPTDKKKMKRGIRATNKAKKILKNFGYVDILVHHQPPLGTLDKVTNPAAPKAWQGKHAGSEVIRDYLKRHQPNYAFCGHIHEGEGQVRIGKTQVYNLGVGGHKLIEL